MVTRVPDTVAIILARGGSKGIPKKNITEFAGKPLITWTISQVLEAGIRDVYVSTDDEEIARTAVNAGAKIVARPAELAGDLASGDEAVIHAIDVLGLSPDTIIIMPQVTSPLRFPEHLIEVLMLMASGEADSVFSANRVDDTCVWEMTGTPKSVTYDYRNRGMRQERAVTVVENGSIYATTVGAIRVSRNRLNGRIRASLMPKWTWPEIDDPEDLLLCEVLMRAFVKNEKGLRL